MSTLFAKNLKYFRELNGFTQSDLAKFAGTSRNAIANYEVGRTEPNFEILCELARVLGCEIADLVDKKERNPVMQESAGQVLRRLLTDDEAALIQAYREADPVYQTVAMDILRTHKRR